MAQLIEADKRYFTIDSKRKEDAAKIKDYRNRVSKILKRPKVVQAAMKKTVKQEKLDTSENEDMKVENSNSLINIQTSSEPEVTFKLPVMERKTNEDTNVTVETEYNSTEKRQQQLHIKRIPLNTDIQVTLENSPQPTQESAATPHKLNLNRSPFLQAPIRKAVYHDW